MKIETWRISSRSNQKDWTKITFGTIEITSAEINFTKCKLNNGLFGIQTTMKERMAENIMMQSTWTLPEHR